MKYEGKAGGMIEDLKGIQYITRLIEKRPQALSVEALASSIEGYSPLDKHEAEYSGKLNRMAEEELEKEGLSRKFSIEQLSDKDREALEDTLLKAYQALVDARAGGFARIHEANLQWEEAKRHMLNEYGVKVYVIRGELSYKYLTRLNKDADQLRTAIHNDIKKAKNRIKKHLPALYDHLEAHLRTGAECSYKLRPENIEWLINF